MNLETKIYHHPHAENLPHMGTNEVVRKLRDMEQSIRNATKAIETGKFLKRDKVNHNEAISIYSLLLFL